ncbi:MAG: hypothetical protein ABI232_00310 [Jatrophihabitantaceae bacterium]
MTLAGLNVRPVECMQWAVERLTADAQRIREFVAQPGSATERSWVQPGAAGCCRVTAIRGTYAGRRARKASIRAL